MRVSTMTYILKQGFKNIWRNIRFSLASIATMAACIFLFGIFLSLVMNFRYMVHSAEEGVAVVVYFDEGVKQEQIDDIGSKIKKMSEVERAEYVSADQAWEAFRDEYLGGDDTLAEGFRDQDNPLANSASYQVYLKNVESQDKVVKEIEKMDGVRQVSQSQSAAKTLSTFNKLIGYVSLAIIFILLAVAFFLISNTITMGISVRQEEIGIMKLIGATDFFVRVPFVIEGIILGIIACIQNFTSGRVRSWNWNRILWKYSFCKKTFKSIIKVSTEIFRQIRRRYSQENSGCISLFCERRQKSWKKTK